MMAARVLLVDDDPHILMALRRQIDGRFDTVDAAGGLEAVAAAEAARDTGQPFAAAVCDMHMPGMDGIETLRRIFELSPLTVPIMLTGDCDQHTAIDAINRGHIFRFFVKPIDSSPLIDGILAALRQHDLLQAEARLVENEERWRLALDAVGDGVWDWHPPTGRAFFSHRWREMLGLPVQTGDGSVSEWKQRVHPEDAATLHDQMARLLDGRDQALHSEHRMQTADGSFRWFLARGTVLFRQPDGTAQRVIGTHTDVTERRHMEETLRRQSEQLALLASTDSLTGLWNRRHFLEQAELELQRALRYGRPVSVMMIDIDHFKRVNDTYGHPAGDAVLRHFAAIIRSNLRKSDCLGRVGGEEFAVLLPESDMEQARIVAETLRRETAVTRVGLDDGTALGITASFGLTSARPGEELVSDLLLRADRALYAAKDGGRNRVESA
jgi:diguanylate cyclase (GGDEF)-like protein/PAS domain S-box-containing protein